MNELPTSRRTLRRFAPLLVAVVLGIALATFAGLSSSGDGGGERRSAYVAPAAQPERVALLDATIAGLSTPVHGRLELDPVDAPPIRLDGRSVELRVLFIRHGADAAGETVGQMAELLDVVGVPYDVVDAESDRLTPDMLADGLSGRYNGIILTDAELLNLDGTPGLTPRGWQALEAYSRDFGVRQVVMSGFPGWTPGSYDYGVDDASLVEDPTARWTAAGAEVFGSVALDATVRIDGGAFVAELRTDGTGPEVEPLLVDDASGGALVSLLRYRDGREVLLSSIPMGASRDHSYALLYDMLRFATSGVHLGAARVQLAAHVDDLFLDYVVWDTDANGPGAEVIPTEPADIEAIVAMQQQLVADFSTLSAFAVDFPFNGGGAALAPEGQSTTGDPLTDAVLANRDQLRFLNHTYEHRDLDVSAGASGEDARSDLLRNRAMWELLGLPDSEANAAVVVTGEHSGVWDDPGDGEASRETPFPEGLNTAMAAAFEQEGIRYLAGDASEASQAQIQGVPGFDMVLLPRYPTGVLLNAASPEDQVDQYNWFFNEQFVEAGQDPCQIPAATCELADYDTVLAAEALVTVRHMLSFRDWPHYFHMANVADYDGAGSTLLGDWLEAALAEYEQRSSLPVENLTFAEIGARTEAQLVARAARPIGVLDLESGEVVLAAGRDVELSVTGLAGGEPYGPVVQRTVMVGPEPTRFAVD